MRRTSVLALASAVAVVATLSVASPPAVAQEPGVREAPRARRVVVRPRPRIVVTPANRLYRHCEDIYVVENRPTGPTVVPDMRCWWAYR